MLGPSHAALLLDLAKGVISGTCRFDVQVKVMGPGRTLFGSLCSLVLALPLSGCSIVSLSVPSSSPTAAESTRKTCRRAPASMGTDAVLAMGGALDLVFPADDPDLRKAEKIIGYTALAVSVPSLLYGAFVLARCEQVAPAAEKHIASAANATAPGHTTFPTPCSGSSSRPTRRRPRLRALQIVEGAGETAQRARFATGVILLAVDPTYVSNFVVDRSASSPSCIQSRASSFTRGLTKRSKSSPRTMGGPSVGPHHGAPSAATKPLRNACKRAKSLGVRCGTGRAAILSSCPSSSPASSSWRRVTSVTRPTEP